MESRDDLVDRREEDRKQMQVDGAESSSSAFEVLCNFPNIALFVT